MEDYNFELVKLASFYHKTFLNQLKNRDLGILGRSEKSCVKKLSSWMSIIHRLAIQ